MNDRPSVTNTCANASPGSFLSKKRSVSAPRIATPSVARIAASQKFNFTPATPMMRAAPK